MRCVTGAASGTTSGTAVACVPLVRATCDGNGGGTTGAFVALAARLAEVASAAFTAPPASRPSAFDRVIAKILLCVSAADSSVRPSSCRRRESGEQGTSRDKRYQREPSCEEAPRTRAKIAVTSKTIRRHRRSVSVTRASRVRIAPLRMPRVERARRVLRMRRRMRSGGAPRRDSPDLERSARCGLDLGRVLPGGLFSKGDNR